MPARTEPVAVNTGPLLALRACGQMELLHQLHSRIVVPQVVVEELDRVRARGNHPEAAPTETLPGWLEVRSLELPPSAFLRAYLDDGEAAVIALAQQLDLSRVVIDERRGRLAARTVGLQVTGSIGILLRAKRLGLLPAVKPSLNAMKSAGVWLNDRLLQQILREAGE